MNVKGHERSNRKDIDNYSNTINPFEKDRLYEQSIIPNHFVRTDPNSSKQKFRTQVRTDGPTRTDLVHSRSYKSKK